MKYSNLIEGFTVDIEEDTIITCNNRYYLSKKCQVVEHANILCFIEDCESANPTGNRDIVYRDIIGECAGKYLVCSIVYNWSDATNMEFIDRIEIISGSPRAISKSRLSRVINFSSPRFPCTNIQEWSVKYRHHVSDTHGYVCKEYVIDTHTSSVYEDYYFEYVDSISGVSHKVSLQDCTGFSSDSYKTGDNFSKSTTITRDIITIVHKSEYHVLILLPM